jgi:hypothetical protein
MKIHFLISAFIFLAGIARGQTFKGMISAGKVPPPAFHYTEEYTFDTTLNASVWLTQKKGLNVSFASTDELYFRTEVPQIVNTNSWEATAWKGERINMMILIWSPDTLQQVRCNIIDLKSANGKLISKKNMQVNMVRYVVSNYPYGAKDASCGESQYKDLYLMPDRFEAIERFELPGKTVRPVWISLDIPSTTETGVYTSSIEVRSENETTKLELKVNVQKQILPAPHEWKHRLDIWQNPWAVAWKNNVKPWSPEHIALLKKHLKLYADAGGTFITTYAVHSPWSDNSYMIEGGMIEWIKRSDQSWKFDYTLFDQYVQLAMSMGIDRAITIYTPVPWGFRFRYMDANTGNYIYATWPPDSKEFKSVWNVFLTDLQNHLKQKGWFNITYLGINENEMSQTLAAIKVIKEHSKEWKITYAGDWHPELDNLLDDYCFVYGKETNIDTVKARTKKGRTTTFYVCCTPPYPNNFVYSPPIEGRWLSWYTSAHSYDGFLRWAYDAWPSDVIRDARHPFWPAGDCYLVYPGGNSCIRFEKLREGIVDFEKIRILRQKAKDKNRQDLMKELDQHMKVFIEEKDFDSKKIKADVDKGRKIVDALSEKL